LAKFWKFCCHFDFSLTIVSFLYPLAKIKAHFNLFSFLFFFSARKKERKIEPKNKKKSYFSKLKIWKPITTFLSKKKD